MPRPLLNSGSDGPLLTRPSGVCSVDQKKSLIFPLDRAPAILAKRFHGQILLRARQKQYQQTIAARNEFSRGEIAEGQKMKGQIKEMNNRKMIFGAILSVLACFVLLPQMRAASDNPEAFVGSNTFDGFRALFSQ